MQNTNNTLEPLPRFADRFAPGNMRGSILRVHIDWVRDHRDRDEVIEFFEALPLEMRSVVGASWVRFEELMDVERLIVNRFGSGKLDILREVGAYAARRALAGAHRHLQRSGVHEFLRSVISRHAEVQDFGTAGYREVSPASGEVTIENDTPQFRASLRHDISITPLYCATLQGYYRECVRLHGGVRVSVVEVQCQCTGAESCRFELNWE